jgi:hypothetical protein
VIQKLLVVTVKLNLIYHSEEEIIIMNLKRILLVAFASAVLIIAGCFLPMVVNQPESAEVGEMITTTLGITIDEQGEAGQDDGPSGGICAVLLDTNWTVESMEYDGDYGPDEMLWLHPDSVDNRPDAGVDYWYDTLRVNFPPPAGMDWYVYQGTENHFWIDETSRVDVTIEINVESAGEHNIGYFVSVNDLKLDDPGNYTVSLENPISVSPSAIEEDGVGTVTKKFGLDQNYPNPFNPSTTIRYQLDKTGDVRLSVFDISGKEVAVLFNGSQNAGEHQVEFYGENLSSGVYLYRLVAGDQSYVRKMMLVK